MGLGRFVRKLFGGGSGGGDSSADYMAQVERERQRKIAEATAAVNRAFNMTDRQALYDDQRDAVYALNTAEVERQAEQAARQNKFALARSGLLGGSADVDSQAELNRRTNEGLMNAAGIADDAAAALRKSDETTKQNLLTLAQNGISANDAGQLASSQLANNISSAAADAAAAKIGNLFGDLGYGYMYGNQAQNAIAQNDYLGSLYAKNRGAVADTHGGYGGTITR